MGPSVAVSGIAAGLLGQTGPALMPEIEYPVDLGTVVAVVVGAGGALLLLWFGPLIGFTFAKSLVERLKGAVLGADERMHRLEVWAGNGDDDGGGGVDEEYRRHWREVELARRVLPGGTVLTERQYDLLIERDLRLISEGRLEEDEREYDHDKFMARRARKLARRGG